MKEPHPSWSGCKGKWEASVSRQSHVAPVPACHHIKSDYCAIFSATSWSSCRCSSVRAANERVVCLLKRWPPVVWAVLQKHKFDIRSLLVYNLHIWERQFEVFGSSMQTPRRVRLRTLFLRCSTPRGQPWLWCKIMRNVFTFHRASTWDCFKNSFFPPSLQRSLRQWRKQMFSELRRSIIFQNIFHLGIKILISFFQIQPYSPLLQSKKWALDSIDCDFKG